MTDESVSSNVTVSGGNVGPGPLVCRICGTPRADRTFTANGYDWLDCDHCGSLQKVLTPQQYRDLNASYDPGTYLDGASREHVEAFIGVPAAKRVIQQVLARHGPAAHVAGMARDFLDVGCGMGANLLAARELGFGVLGFEPSRDHARVALQHFDLPVIGDYFAAAKVGPRKFDLIMLSHVIEHIYMPAAFLRELILLLKPGGILLVVTPNTDSLLARLTGPAWPMLKPVDHVSMISARTYPHFGLADLVQVSHWDSEYPYEFAATFASILKHRRASPSTGTAPQAAPPPLRELTMKTRCLKMALTLASMPAWTFAAATRRRACLNTALVRR